MLHGIDHIAIAVADLDAAARDLEQRLGLAAGGGGRHEGMGTSNRIAWLADGSYLELIAVDDAKEAAGWPMGVAAVEALDRGGGFAAVALDDRPLEPDVRALTGAGSQLGAVTHGSRVRPDGELVEWWSAVPPRIGADGVPFLIEHAMTGVEWGAEALAERAAYRHPIGSPVGLVGLDLAADDPSDLAAEYHRQVGVDIRSVADSAVATVGRHVLRLVPRQLAQAPAVVRLAADADPRDADLLGVRFSVEQAAPDSFR